MEKVVAKSSSLCIFQHSPGDSPGLHAYILIFMKHMTVMRQMLLRNAIEVDCTSGLQDKQ